MKLKTYQLILAVVGMGIILGIVASMVFRPLHYPTISAPAGSAGGKPEAKPELDIDRLLKWDLYGDNSKEDIVLHRQKDADGRPVSLQLVVDGAVKLLLGLEDGFTYDSGRLKFDDVDNDSKDEVLLYRISMGTSHAIGLDIYKPSRNDWQKILAAGNTDPDVINSRYAVKYIGNYQVSFMDKQTGLKSIIDLDRASYQGREEQFKEISAWVDPICNYIIEDRDGDGVKEIYAVQRIFGLSHTDPIAGLKTTYKIESGCYRPATLTLTTPIGDPLKNEGSLLSEVEL